MHALWLALWFLGAAPTRVTDDQGCNKGLDENGALHGEIVCKGPGGTRKYEGTYSHGKKVGVAKTWRSDGKLAAVDRYLDGQRHGLCEEYDREGNLEEACEYKAGRRHGLCRLYARGGVLREERRYVAGEQRGAWTVYWPEGGPRERGGFDEQGKRHGPRERFREGGGKESSEPWVHGKREGLAREWYPSGKPRREQTWAGDVLHGLSRSFHETGQLEAVTCYREGALVPGTAACTGKKGPEVWTRYFADGKPAEVVTYLDGKRHGEHRLLNRDGSLRSATSYLHDLRDGAEKLFEGGRLRRALLWRAGKKDGVEVVYFEDGKVAEETSWKDDVRQAHTAYWMNGKKRRTEVLDGELVRRTAYYDTGQTESEETVRAGWTRGALTGLQREWAENGTLIGELSWAGGKLHGVQKSFSPKTGRLLAEEEWATGVRLSRKEWDEAGQVVKDERYNPDGSRK